MLGTPLPRRARTLRAATTAVLAAALTLTAAGSAQAAPAGTARPAAPAAGTVTTAWTEQFDGPAGSPPDPSRWRHDLGGGGWGNGESQTYTDSTANARLTGRGTLLIQTLGQTATGPDGITRDYTSARLVSTDAFRYGTVSAKIRLTGAPGAWPAFWTLGANIGEVGWPACGELDILEALNDFPTLYGTVHGPQTTGPSWQAYGHGGQVSPAGGLGTGWHTYGVRWTPKAVTWLLDGTAYRTVRKSDLPPTDIWAMDTPQNLLLNVAVGGWAGTPAAPADFAASMEVAWVKVVPLPTS